MSSAIPLVFQVQGEIEQLRVSQAEKLLQLKEAATRRKLQELKQQLLHSNTALVSPGPSDQQHSSVSRAPTIPHSQSVIQSYPHSTTPGNERLHYTPPSTAPQQQTHAKQYSSSPRQTTTEVGRQSLSLESSTRQENSNQEELLSSKYLPSCSNEVGKERERMTDRVGCVGREKEQDNILRANSMGNEPIHKKTTVISSQASAPSGISLTHTKSSPFKGHLQHESEESRVLISIKNLRPPVSVYKNYIFICVCI